MRAVIDARPALDPRRTGVGHYTQQLIRHLPHADPDSQYVAWYLHAKGIIRSRTFFAGVHASNLEERASRFPARVFEPLSSRIGEIMSDTGIRSPRTSFRRRRGARAW